MDHLNQEGLTALLIAAKNGYIECASILALDGKACISFRDRDKGWYYAHPANIYTDGSHQRDVYRSFNI